VVGASMISEERLLSAAELAAYLERVGYDGALAPSLAVLDALIAHHTRTIPFENLDILLGRGISLDEDAVFDKLVTRRRGGYCFEQNTLFLRVLRSVGFHATPVSARVRIQRPREMIPPRTHVFLRVVVGDEVRLADVGVGALSPTASLRLVPDEVQDTPHEPRRLIFEDGLWFHQVRLGDTWSDVCEFTGEWMPVIDRELGNWFTSAHPASHFKNRLMAALAGPDGQRITVLNREFSVRGRSGAAVATPVDSPEALLALLAGRFGLAFEPGTRFQCEALDWPASEAGGGQ
jgi:N-hydroxyarylamine O-acetyltransferase